MIRSLFAASLVLCFFVSCKKTDTTQQPNFNACLPDSIIESGGKAYHAVYQDQKMIKCVSSLDSIQYYYNVQGKVTASEKYVPWHPAFDKRYEFNYDPSGNLLEERLYAYNSALNQVILTERADYFYINGKISGIIDSSPNAIDYIRYQWQGDNITVETDSIPGVITETTQFFYDTNHENTLVTRIPQFYLLLPDWVPDAFPVYLSRNPVIKMINSSPGNPAIEYDYTCTYTSGGRLKSCITPTSISYRFYYSCDNP